MDAGLTRKLGTELIGKLIWREDVGLNKDYSEVWYVF